MDFYANEGKAVTIQANGKTYAAMRLQHISSR